MSSRGVSKGPNRYPALDRTAVLRALVPADRRRILSVVLDAVAPIGELTVAARAVADQRGVPVSEVSDRETRDARVRLRQVHLPALDDVRLVVWYRADEVVAPTGHAGLRDPLVLRILRRSVDDDVIEALADRRRRTALALLQTESGATSAAALARGIALRTSDPGIAVEDVTLSLRHVHLPKLDAAGLIDHDREDGTVTYRGHPAVDGPWFGWLRDDPTGPRSLPDSPEDPGNHEND